jgi:hypothetical protein
MIYYCPCLLCAWEDEEECPICGAKGIEGKPDFEVVWVNVRNEGQREEG